jgi:hypothetical protein
MAGLNFFNTISMDAWRRPGDLSETPGVLGPENGGRVTHPLFSALDVWQWLGLCCCFCDGGKEGPWAGVGSIESRPPRDGDDR